MKTKTNKIIVKNTFSHKQISSTKKTVTIQ